MMTLDIIIIAIIGLTRAFRIRRVRNFELCGEALGLLYADIFWCLLNEEIPADCRDVLGWTLVAGLSLTILTGAGRLLVQAYRRTCRSCRRRKARKNALKKHKQQQEKQKKSKKARVTPSYAVEVLPPLEERQA